jgi:hypothetical protein
MQKEPQVCYGRQEKRSRFQLPAASGNSFGSVVISELKSLPILVLPALTRAIEPGHQERYLFRATAEEVQTEKR